MTAALALEQLAALFQGDSEAARSLPEAGWLEVVATANQHLLAPALHAALTRHGLIGMIPEEVDRYLGLLAELNQMRSTALRAEIREAVAALNAAGTMPLLLKGAAALMDPARPVDGRIVGDIDLLVPAPDGQAACAALLRAGFDILESHPPDYHTIADLEREGCLACIDLHREVLHTGFRPLLPGHGMLARARPVTEEDSPGYLLPAPRDRALHLILHAQLHDNGYFLRRLCLRPAYELAVLADRVDWDDLKGWAQRHGLAPMIESMLLIAVRFFGLAWPWPAPPQPAAWQHAQRCCELWAGDAAAVPAMSLRERAGGHLFLYRLAARLDRRGWYLRHVLLARLVQRLRAEPELPGGEAEVTSAR